jgi:hypothetical protein
VAPGARTVVTLTLTALPGAVIAFVLRGHQTAGPPIRIDGARVVVENRTGKVWKDVNVTINAYYRVRTPSPDPGGRLETPVTGLETGLGQRFNPAREHVTHVEVRATDASGASVTIDWDENGKQ